MTSPLSGVVEQRYGVVQEALTKVGSSATVVAITKGHKTWAVEAAISCGISDIGESYAQECLSKLSDIPVTPKVHFVGNLQRNKVKSLAEVIDLWQSIDRAPLIKEIARYAPEATALIQVNLTGATAQGGCDPTEIEDLLTAAQEHGLQVVGLMTIGALNDPAATAQCFKTLRDLTEQLELKECSMGMSDDYEIALAEGATMIRLGTTLFGPRPEH